MPVIRRRKITFGKAGVSAPTKPKTPTKPHTPFKPQPTKQPTKIPNPFLPGPGVTPAPKARKIKTSKSFPKKLTLRRK